MIDTTYTICTDLLGPLSMAIYVIGIHDVVKEALRITGRFETLHAPLALTRRPMQILTLVIERTTLALFHPK